MLACDKAEKRKKGDGEKGDGEKARCSATALFAPIKEAKKNRDKVSEAYGEHPIEMTIFPDGRAIIRGTEDRALARTLYSRYIGT